MGDYTVEVEGLIARYGSRTVLAGVDLYVRPREIRAILGGSGSGKSTLVKHVVGLLRPHGGTLRLLGVDLGEADESERGRLLGRIGMLFQGGALLNSMTVFDNVALPLRERTALSPVVVSEVVRMKLALVGLDGTEHLFPTELSGGMRKRVAIARAMALDPEVLFCDEPSAGLDPITAAALDDTLLSLRDRFGMSVVVVTHELASVETIADRVTMIHEGQVIEDGPLAEVRRSEHPRVRAFFRRESDASERRHASVRARLQRGFPAWT